MFFVPKKDSTLTIKYESGAGWIVSAGTVTSDNSLLYENGYGEDSCFEWHGLYSEMPDSMTATLMLEKQIDGEDAELSETFQFSIDRYSVGNQGAVDEENYWNHIETINNEGEAIFYSIADPQGNPIVYRVKEAGVDSADGTYSMDSTVYYARIRIKSISGTHAIATVEYYTDFLGAYNGTEEGKLNKTPTFVNKEMPVYGPRITKKLEDAATGHAVEKTYWPTDGFTFTIAADSENTGEGLTDQAVYRVEANSSVSIEIPVIELEQYIENFDNNVSGYNLTGAEKTSLKNKLDSLSTAKANIANNKLAVFKGITFKQAGTYGFTITENIPEDAVDGVKDDVTYTQNPVSVSVVVEDVDGSLEVTSVSYVQGETTVEANTASAISSLSLEYVNKYKEETVEETGKITFTKSVTGGVTEEEAKGALTFTIQNTTTGNYLHVREEGEVSWAEDEAELTLGALSKVSGYSIAGNAENGFLFTVVLDNVDIGTYTITETNSAIEGFIAKDTSVTTGSEELAAGGEKQIDLRDDYEEVGSLELTKTIEGDLTLAEIEGDLTFVVTTTVGEGEGAKTKYLAAGRIPPQILPSDSSAKLTATQ